MVHNTQIGKYLITQQDFKSYSYWKIYFHQFSLLFLYYNFKIFTVCHGRNPRYLKIIEVGFHSSWKSFHEPSFLKLFLHHLYYEFIVSIDLKFCQTSINISCKKEMFCIRETINIASSNSLKQGVLSSWKSFHKPLFLNYSFIICIMNSLIQWT